MLNQGLIMEDHNNGGGKTRGSCERELYAISSPNLMSNFSGSWPLGADDLKRPLCSTSATTTTTNNNSRIPPLLSCYAHANALLDDEAVTRTLTHPHHHHHHQPLLSSTTCTPYKQLISRPAEEDSPSSSPLFSLQAPIIPTYYNQYHLWAWRAEGEGIKQEYQAAAGGGGGGGGRINNNNDDDDSSKMTISGTAWGSGWGWGGEDYSSPGHHGHHDHVGFGAGVGVPAMKTKTKMKMKKQMRRKVREPRFSFKTMTDVDVLDDGYKWRKYGQKVVKNTLHPRSYYRCTRDKCRVKKRVERLAEDPRMVITTYEGRHIHSPSNDLDESHSPGQPHLNQFF